MKREEGVWGEMQAMPDLKITRRAGRLTPAAKVEVAHSTEMAPVLYAFSTNSRSSPVRPALTA